MKGKKRKKLTPLGLVACAVYTVFILAVVFLLGLRPVSFFGGMGSLLVFMVIFVVSMVLFIALLNSSDRLLREGRSSTSRSSSSPSGLP